MELQVLVKLVFCFLIRDSQGFVYRVKSDKVHGTLCYTNETSRAVAFVRTLPNVDVPSKVWLTKSSTVKYSPILTGEKFTGMPYCHISQYSCAGWDTREFIKEKSIHASSDLPPIFDRRWNDLPEYITKGDNSVIKMAQLNENAAGTLHLSVLAIHSALVILSQDDFKTGFVVSVDGNYNGVVKSKLRYCSEIRKREYVYECTSMSELNHVTRILANGSVWNLISIQYNLKTFDLQVLFNNVQILRATNLQRQEIPRYKFINVTCFNFLNTITYILFSSLIKSYFSEFKSNWIQSKKWEVGVRTFKTPAIFKIHSYDVLRPRDRMNRKIETDIVISSQRRHICLDLTYFCAERPSNEDILVSIVNASKYVIEKILLLTNEKGVWKHGRIESKALPLGSYKLSITIISTYVYLGDISVCPEGSTMVASADTDVQKCSILGDFQTESVQGTFNGLTGLEADTLCKTFSDCYGVKFCSGSHCSCLSGHKENQCIERCTSGYYGPNCSKLRGCAGNYNIHTGHCSSGCKPLYRQPMCIKRRLEFEHAPHITITEPRRILVNLSGAMETLRKKYGEAEVTQNFGFVELDLRNGSRWTTFSRLNKTSDFSNILVDGLLPSTDYEIRAIVLEVTDKRKNFNVELTKRFKTLPCIPINKGNIVAKYHGTLRILVERQLDVCTWAELHLFCGNKTQKFTAQEYNNTYWLERIDQGSECELNLIGSDGSKTHLKIQYINSDGITSVIIVAVIFVCTALVIMMVGLFVWRRKRNQPVTTDALRYSGDIRDVELTQTPMSDGENDCARYQELAKVKSCVVKLAQLDRYIEDAIRTNLMKQQLELFPRGQTRPSIVGTKPTNKSKNRYNNLAAYDATRVILDMLLGDPESDYINANYIDGYKRPKTYIATQGPKPKTVIDFWRMIWQDNVTIIVMLANCVENKKIKCEKYWPDQKGTLTFGNFTVSNGGEEVFADHVCRILVLSKAEWTRKITHMHFTNWPSHHVPVYQHPMAVFVESVNRIPTESPIVVHCSGGFGRTGTFILVDICVRMGKAEECVDILGTLNRIRQQRPNMVENALQYQFAHEVILECLLMAQKNLKCEGFRKKL